VAQPGAHNEQVGAEPTGRLLNMAARDEAGETDSHEPETLDEIIQDSFGASSSLGLQPVLDHLVLCYSTP